MTLEDITPEQKARILPLLREELAECARTFDAQTSHLSPSATRTNPARQ